MALDDADQIKIFLSQIYERTSPSPHISGIKPPQNTPKTAASTAIDTHNQIVSAAFSDYVNSMNGRPLSESIWAPGSTRKPSMLTGARSANVLTPVNAVQLDPAVNNTFDRMTSKAADSHHKLASSTSKADLPPHLRAIQGSSQKPVKTEGLSPVVPSKPAASGPPHLRAIRGSSQKPVKTEGLSPVVPSKPAASGSAKDAVRVATIGVESKIITGSADKKPLADAPSQSEDLEHEIFFNTWPKLEERSRPGEFRQKICPAMGANRQTAAKVRKVIIKDLPRGSTATFVASLVYGGPIEEIHVRSSAAGELSAAIRFMNAEDCIRFYNETSNGLVWQKDSTGHELFVFVELSKDVDVVGGLLQGWILSGVTRCVRAVGIDAEWGMEGLLKIAERKNRKVEKIVDGQNPGGVSTQLTLVPSH